MAESEPLATLPTRGRRTHPLTSVVQGGLWGGAAAIAIGSSYLQGDGWGEVPWWVALLGVLGGGLLVGQLLGFVSWWFTRYVVDDHEVRIDSGVLNRRSRRGAFERIQAVDVAEPFLARVAGLAEVRVDLAGGDESRLVVRFLPVDQAQEVRRLLLRRAHGNVAADGPTGPDREDEPDAQDLITRVTPERTMLGALLSLDLLTALGAVVAVLLAAVGFGAPLVLLGGALPALSWGAQLIARRVVGEWGFTLWRTEHGLRIERGLLSLTSQTIPLARVQGVAVVEPLLWRRLGWCRLEVDVAGSGSGEDADRQTTLLPIADRALAEALVAELVPEAAPHERTDHSTAVHASRRSWPFAPVGWRYRWLDLGVHRATSSTGWLTRRTSSAPLAKAQSIALRQGPLQRRLGLATVELHTPDGPVDVDVHHLDGPAARDLALQTVDRARSARADAAGSASAGGVLGGGIHTADHLA